jgi:hypothetical protein
MIEADFGGSDVRVEMYLRSRGPAIEAALLSKSDYLMLKLQAYIVDEKLSGQVLNRRTGTAAGSVRTVPATNEGGSITAGVVGGGGPAFYLAIHEYGGEGPYEIVPNEKKALAFLVGGEQVVVRRVIHPPAQERRPMRSGLEDMRDEIISGLQSAIAEAG